MLLPAREERHKRDGKSDGDEGERRPDREEPEDGSDIDDDQHQGQERPQDDTEHRSCDDDGIKTARRLLCIVWPLLVVDHS